jgi:alkyl sulfatase BDS1-like metallo-beta-lactamase superfamily hydrolase
MMGTANLAQQIHAGNATLTGDPKKLAGFLLWLDKFEFWFQIVTP